METPRPMLESPVHEAAGVTQGRVEITCEYPLVCGNRNIAKPEAYSTSRLVG